jgi:hypothetical protein
MEKKDCFAYVSSWKCKALNDVVCKTGECPFYKTQEQFEKDAEKANKKKQRSNEVC